ncbi:MAG TPA: ABC transporter ATP-binding protein [Gemmatimonadales bacterium]
MLAVAVAKRLGEFGLDMSFDLDDGTTLVVVGESGSGKSTLLRLLAGLQEPDSGTITLDGKPYFDRAAAAHVPPWERSIGFVPQDYALFPHLTVAENVAFGLRAAGTGDRETRRRVMRSLEQLGVAELTTAYPRTLSGGQQQRVALARALVLEPHLLLLDEPMSALDLNTRRSIRTELRRILDSSPCITIYVTHAPAEALMLGDRIAAIEDGRVTQIGSRDDFLRRPQSQYVAAFLGVNLLHGRIVERRGASSEGKSLVRVATLRGEIWCSAPQDDSGGTDVTLTIAPDVVCLSRERPVDGVGVNAMQGRVIEMAPEPPRGQRMLVTIDGEPVIVAEVEREVVAALGLRTGEMIWASFDANQVQCEV